MTKSKKDLLTGLVALSTLILSQGCSTGSAGYGASAGRPGRMVALQPSNALGDPGALFFADPAVIEYHCRDCGGTRTALAHRTGGLTECPSCDPLGGTPALASR